MNQTKLNHGMRTVCNVLACLCMCWIANSKWLLHFAYEARNNEVEHSIGRNKQPKIAELLVNNTEHSYCAHCW